jgi:hypothetical protein
MNLRISFLAKSRAPSMGVRPLPIAHFTGDFASLKDARKIAFTDADKPEIKANSILIQSVDETMIEYWVRNGRDWKVSDPAAVTGDTEDDWGR